MDLPGHIRLTAHTPSLQHKHWSSHIFLFAAADAQAIVPTEPACKCAKPRGLLILDLLLKELMCLTIKLKIWNRNQKICNLLLAIMVLNTDRTWLEKLSQKGKTYINLYNVTYTVSFWNEQDIKSEQGKWWKAVLHIILACNVCSAQGHWTVCLDKAFEIQIPLLLNW